MLSKLFLHKVANMIKIKLFLLNVANVNKILVLIKMTDVIQTISFAWNNKMTKL